MVSLYAHFFWMWNVSAFFVIFPAVSIVRNTTPAPGCHDRGGLGGGAPLGVVHADEEVAEGLEARQRRGAVLCGHLPPGSRARPGTSLALSSPHWNEKSNGTHFFDKKMARITPVKLPAEPTLLSLCACEIIKGGLI